MVQAQQQVMELPFYTADDLLAQFRAPAQPRAAAE